MSILAGLGTALGAAAPIIDTGVNAYLGAKNYELQKNNYDYLKSAQQTTWNREDNAVQRRANDLQRAGLSKTLAAGSAASSSAPIQISAPQVDYKSNLQGALAGHSALMRQKADISKTIAENQLIALQSEKTKNDTIGSSLSNNRLEMENAARAFDIKHFQDLGLSSNSTGLAADIANLIGVIKKNLPSMGSFGNALSDVAGKVKETTQQAVTKLKDWESKQPLGPTQQAQRQEELDIKTEKGIRRLPLGNKLMDWYNSK